MSQLPPSTPAYVPPAPKQGNLAAVLSLITGILFCIPGLGVLALIFGIVGVKKASSPQVGGKGMAIAGIILGVCGLIVTGIAIVIGGAGIAVWKYGAPAREATHQFVVDIAAGKQAAALADCTKDMDPTKIDALITQAKDWGAFKDTLLPAVNIQNNNGVTTATIGGVATFDKGTQPVVATLQKEGDKFKIAEFGFINQKPSN